MEKDRPFSFTLLVPPRVSSGGHPVKPQEPVDDCGGFKHRLQQSYNSKPQEPVDDCGGFMQTLQQSYSKCVDKERASSQSLLLPNTSMALPTKPTRTDVPKMRVVPAMEKEADNGNPAQLYSKLFEEVEKIKSWKVKVDAETMQKERRLQEHKRTIENQRKAIHELQFGSESLSIKLEEQLTENEDLRNKNNVTRNLCNILKDTFEHSADSIHLFESEREESHNLFLQNNENIQRMVAAFEDLRIQAEADQHQMQKVKEALLQVEGLKDNFEQEYNMKHEEAAVLQIKLKDKETELQQVSVKLHDTKESCKQLQESANQHYELLQCSKKEHDSLLLKLKQAEQRVKEREENQIAIARALEQNKEESADIIFRKDSSLMELNKVKDELQDKLIEIQATAQELQNSLTLEKERAMELEVQLATISKELENKTIALGKILAQCEQKNGQIKIVEDELILKTKSIASLMEKIEVIEIRLEELKAELSRKNEEAKLIQNKVVMLSAEKIQLEKACEEVENAHSDLKEKTNMTEIKLQEMDCRLSVELKRNEATMLEMKQLKSDIMLHEAKYKELLSGFNELQLERDTIQEQVESGTSEVKTLEAKLKTSKEKGMNLTKEMKRLEEENHCLREDVISLNTRIEEQCQETENLQRNTTENCEDLQKEFTKKEKQIKAVESKLSIFKTKFEAKSKEYEECHKENKMLKKQVAKEISKSSHLQDEISNLKEETLNLKGLNEEEQQKLVEDLSSKSSFAEKLQNEVQNLRLAATEAIKNKEDTELKCQNKIADMVALMEKHKSQYDRMVEEKDAELEEKKRKEMESVASRTSLEFELSHTKTKNDSLNTQLKKEMAEKEKLRNQLNDLEKEISSLKISEQSSKQTPQEPSLKRHVLDSLKTRKTPSHRKWQINAATPKVNNSEINIVRTPLGHATNWVGSVSKVKESDSEASKTPSQDITKDLHPLYTPKNMNADIKTPSWSTTSKSGTTPKIKSYRIRTPPSTEKSAPWKKSILELDPKSDSSEHDTLAFAPEPRLFAPQSKQDFFKKSPAMHKSPGNSMKLAAMKRMRDAGWTAVTGTADRKKKKKITEKIFS